MLCPVCPAEVPRTGGRGRPAKYCSEEHRRQADNDRQAGRRQAHRWPKKCEYEPCGKAYIPTRSDQRFCTTQCGGRWAAWQKAVADREAPRQCRHCLDVFLRDKPHETICEPCRTRRRHEWNNRKSAKRRSAPMGRPVVLAEIATRDGGRCHICSQPVDMQVLGSQPYGPTLDHLTPLALGGIHDPANVALAHRTCNVRRGIKPATGAA